ncbi:MAG: preprotein translocase subunit SecE [Desulfobacter sp.]|nr:preprotein translocase subunit SecE [Desulfobacter sp.]WDP87198.1 MAG: preprotein translocase subunit SecE [Desulfobacter sp.]
MSKIQKKKPLSEKKKRKVGPEDGAPNAVSTAKQAAPKVAPRSKVEKAGAEPVSDNIFTRAAAFVREVKIELEKVTWPTRKQTTGTTIVVILFVFVVAAFLGLFDFSLSRLVQVVLT